MHLIITNNTILYLALTFSAVKVSESLIVSVSNMIKMAKDLQRMNPVDLYCSATMRSTAVVHS